MRLLTLCPGLLANDGLCACVLLKLAYRAPAGDSNSRQFSTESSVGTEPFNAGPSSASSPITVATWTASHRQAECPSHASLSSPLAPPQRRIPHAPYAMCSMSPRQAARLLRTSPGAIPSRAPATSDKSACAWRGVVHVILSVCTPAARISSTQPSCHGASRGRATCNLALES